MTTHLTLYGTEGCHLCDEAQDVLAQLGLQWQAIDIAEDESLLTRYGIRIPVLRRADTGVELDWPFTPEDVKGLLSRKHAPDCPA